MLRDMLKDYKNNDYVYIIEGCTGLYVSDKPCTDEPCPLCGDYDWLYCEGFVSDIKHAKNKEDLHKIQYEKAIITSVKKDENTIYTDLKKIISKEQVPVKKLTKDRNHNKR